MKKRPLEQEIVEIMEVSHATIEKSREQGIQRRAINVNVNGNVPVNINEDMMGESQRSDDKTNAREENKRPPMF